MTALTLTEAARVAGVSLSAVRHAVRAGTLPAVRGADGLWRVEPADAQAYGRQAAQRRARVAQRRREASEAWSPRRVLPAEPLLRQVELRGGPAACGAGQGSAELEALRSAKLYGRVTPRAAEQFAAWLGLSARELWSPERPEYVPARPLLHQVALRGWCGRVCGSGGVGG